MGIWFLGIYVYEGFFFEGMGGWGEYFYIIIFVCFWCRLDYSYIVKIFWI